MNRNERIQDLKQRMVAKYGSCLIALPDDPGAFPLFSKNDTAEERQQKTQRKQQIMDAREAAYKQKVPEMLNELDRIIARIKNARPEQKAGMDGVYSTSAAALSVFSIACDQCGNRDPNNVITDGRRGDRICAGRDGRGCGAVLQDHIEVQGADRRNFEGEDDRRQFGPAPNKLFGDAANMETSLNIEMRGTGKDNSAWKRISQAQQSVEMGLSSVGKEEKHTREGYKTGHKRKAFAQLEVIASDMNIHMQVVQRAKEEFAKYRDAMEAVHNFEGVLLACLILAFEEVSATSSLFDRIQEKFVPLQNPSQGAENSDFGRVRPRQEVHDDTAICSVPSVPLGKFTLEQVREWLLAVGAAGRQGAAEGADFTSEALAVYAYLEKLIAKEAAGLADKATVARNRPELPKSSIFGTVTVSSRLKRYRSTGTESSGHTAADKEGGKAGLHLLRVHNITAALGIRSTNSSSSTSAETNHHHAAESLFREAVVRRSQYDAALLEYERIVALQNTRMRIEDTISTNMQASVLQLGRKTTVSNGNNSNSGNVVEDSMDNSKRQRIENNFTMTKNTQNTASAQSVAVPSEVALDPQETLDIDLEELIGGPVTAVSESRFTSIKKPDSTAKGITGPRSASVNGSSSGVQVKVEGAASTVAAGGKKLGMKPRPKIVIS